MSEKEQFSTLTTGDLSDVEALLNTGFDINTCISWDNRTPIFFAVHSGDLERFEIFLPHVKNINKKDLYGMTILHYACENADRDIVRILLETEKCDLSIDDNRGYTPLHIVANNNSIIIAKLLLAQKDISISARDEDGNTPIHLAIYENSSDVLSLILQKCNRENILSTIFLLQGCSDRTPLSLAIYREARDCIRLLVIYGANTVDFP